MKPENEHDNIAQALAPYAPPQTTDESVPIDADGQPLDYRAIAELLGAIVRERKAVAKYFHCVLLTMLLFFVFNWGMDMWYKDSSFWDWFNLGSFFLGVPAVIFYGMSIYHAQKTEKRLMELKEKSGFHGSLFVRGYDAIPSHAVKLLTQAGYSARGGCIPDMAQFDSVKEDSHEA